ncbi:hypothetical protein PGT21_034998 [Puccinia graminis f. sp. tritici]|uniref:Uncharacterized protein n=1 Tax=Puccinia graminis f. sp. tritici TaxID=56615 RepID=A0A5B0QCW2_PUCGR|nr:hypothetical protein PGT21_034998 [Puccinia graminis f. sp. tritici]
MPRHVAVALDEGCFTEFSTPEGDRFRCEICKSRLLKDRSKHSKLKSHQERTSASKQQCALSLTADQNVTNTTVNLEDEEGLSQEFHNVFLDRTFEKEREDDIHMENDSDSAEHIRPPLEEFDEPAPAENYWDSEDECELDWIDILPEDEANHHGKREQKKGDEEKEKKGKDSPWYPFRNKHVSQILELHPM